VDLNELDGLPESVCTPVLLGAVVPDPDSLTE